MPDLDDRIRNLVASAVADAPPAPPLDNQAAPDAHKRPSWPKWTALLAALIATVGGGIALNPADEGKVDTGRDTTDTTAVPPVAQPSVIVTAGRNGIVSRVGDERKTITTESVTMALALDDGTHVAQRRSGERFLDGGIDEWPKSDTVPLLISEGGGIPTVPLLDADKLDGFVILHDFSVVEGRRLLLYSVDRNSWGGDGDGGNEELFVLDLDTRDSVDLGSIGGWEATTSRLTLGSSGLIIGTGFGACCAPGSFQAFVVPGSPAAAKPLPTLADFGLDSARSDDCDCPTGFALNADGTALYWESPASSDRPATVMTAPFADPHRHTIVASIPNSPDMGFGVLRIDPGDRGVVVSFGSELSGPLGRPLLVDNDSSTKLEGDVGTVGPNG
jgi:hypothetical protein